MTVNDNNPIAPGEHATELLTEYIDGTMEPAERARVRAHLDGCDTCRAEYAELLATRQMLRAVPAVQAPRSFTLTPEMARKVRPPSLFERIFNPANSPGFALGSVLSFVLLFFIVVAPILGSARSPASNTYFTIGSALSGEGGSMPYESAPSSNQHDQDARTMGGQAESTATTGTAAYNTPEVQALAPQPTSQPAAGPGQEPPNVAVAVPHAVPTEPASTTSGGTGTTAGAQSATTMAGSAADTMKQAAPSESSRQAAPANPPVDWGAALMSIAPLFLLALGLVLAVMAWIARSSRPV